MSDLDHTLNLTRLRLSLAEQPEYDTHDRLPRLPRPRDTPDPEPTSAPDWFSLLVTFLTHSKRRPMGRAS